MKKSKAKTLFLLIVLATFCMFRLSSQENASSISSPTVSSSKTLIAYFTWADNTVVEDQSASLESALSHYQSMGDSGSYNQTDAISSSSLVPPGNVARIAGWIHDEIGGTLFSIQVEKPYPSNYDECLKVASREKSRKSLPALKTHVQNMSDYDTIYLGYPNWWYTVPMAILSFINEYDLQNKKIVLFCSHGTGGLAGSVRAITAELSENCNVNKNVLGVYRSEILTSKDKVLKWVHQVE